MSRVLVDKSFTTLDASSDKRAVIEQLARSLAQSRRIKKSDIDVVVDGAMARGGNWQRWDWSWHRDPPLPY